MKIGISGHQQREGIDWRWVRASIDAVLEKYPGRRIGYSSLAVGSDQLFARAIIERGDDLIAVIPAADYESCFYGVDLTTYLILKERATIVKLDFPRSTEKAFYAAGKFIVEQVELLIAVWDGKPAEGLGGTADVVAYARSISKAVSHIDPFAKRVEDF
jgi:hypothetical protein